MVTANKIWRGGFEYLIVGASLLAIRAITDTRVANKFAPTNTKVGLHRRGSRPGLGGLGKTALPNFG